MSEIPHCICSIKKSFGTDTRFHTKTREGNCRFNYSSARLISHKEQTSESHPQGFAFLWEFFRPSAGISWEKWCGSAPRNHIKISFCCDSGGQKWKRAMLRQKHVGNRGWDAVTFVWLKLCWLLHGLFAGSHLGAPLDCSAHTLLLWFMWSYLFWAASNSLLVAVDR